jgi:hypothetical protein
MLRVGDGGPSVSGGQGYSRYARCRACYVAAALIWQSARRVLIVVRFGEDLLRAVNSSRARFE